MPIKLPDNVSPVNLKINPGAHVGDNNVTSKKRAYNNCVIWSAQPPPTLGLDRTRCKWWQILFKRTSSEAAEIGAAAMVLCMLQLHILRFGGVLYSKVQLVNKIWQQCFDQLLLTCGNLITIDDSFKDDRKILRGRGIYYTKPRTRSNKRQHLENVLINYCYVVGNTIMKENCYEDNRKIASWWQEGTLYQPLLKCE